VDQEAARPLYTIMKRFAQLLQREPAAVGFLVRSIVTPRAAGSVDPTG